MQNVNRIPKWLVENDPSWERSIDSNLGMLKWIKKGTGVQAQCPPTSMFCDIIGLTDEAGLSDIMTNLKMSRRMDASGASDITKYLSSRYINPQINGPRFDLRRNNKFSP